MFSHNPIDEQTKTIPPAIQESNLEGETKKESTWQAAALKVAGAALIVLGVATAVVLSVLAFKTMILLPPVGLVIAFKLTPLIGSVFALLAGTIGGTCCLWASHHYEIQTSPQT